jgi:signal transduction histidine kinase
LRLARYRVEGDQARLRAAAHAAQVSAEALDVERVGVWMLYEQGRRLVCLDEYVRSTGGHAFGQTLLSQNYPAYIEGLRLRRVIAADDVRVHPSTRELEPLHLRPRGVGAVLDAPIIRDGGVVGVVSHQHLGQTRAWSQKEIDFASSVADLVALVFEQSDRLELEAALQERAEERLQHEKMEALGRLAVAVAHDFNNLLGSVALTVSTVQDGASPTDRDLCVDALKMVEVGQGLTRQLIAFGKERPDTAPLRTDVRAMIDHAMPVFRASMRRSIEIVVEDSARDPYVLIDPSQLEQLLLNLTLNARDAIGNDRARQGRITIALRDPTPLDGVPPDCLVLTVSDDGAGMDEETRAHVFEPFFSTKAQGSGLGLATVYGIVRRCGGVALVTSEPGSGTTMLVALPRAHPA